jgi:hypothetical protein
MPNHAMPRVSRSLHNIVAVLWGTPICSKPLPAGDDERQVRGYERRRVDEELERVCKRNPIQ